MMKSEEGFGFFSVCVCVTHLTVSEFNPLSKRFVLFSTQPLIQFSSIQFHKHKRKTTQNSAPGFHGRLKKHISSKSKHCSFPGM